MEQLERTAVQLWEAQRLAAHSDVPHGRLALLLLDNAAETLLRRIADTHFVWADMYGDMLRQLGTTDAQDDDETQRLRVKLEEKALSKTARRKVDRDFNSLVDYVSRQPDGPLDDEYVDCLKILHRYRNAAHHQDTVRADVLGSAIQIYFHLCCHLLKHQQYVFDEIGSPPPGVLKVFDGTPPAGNWPAGSFSCTQLASLVADQFMADLHVDHTHVAAALSQHLTARLVAMDDNLDQIADYLHLPDRVVTLRLVQLAPTDPEQLQQDPPKDFWTRRLDVSLDVIDDWTLEAVKIGEVRTAHTALRKFANVEEPLAKLEAPLARFIQEVDRAIQMKIDESRGK